MSTDTVSDAVEINGKECRLSGPTTRPKPVEAHLVWGTSVMYDEYIWAENPVEVYLTEDLGRIVDADGTPVVVVCPNCEAPSVLDESTKVGEEHWRCSTDGCDTLFVSVCKHRYRPPSGFRWLTGGESHRPELVDGERAPYGEAQIVEEDQVVYHGDLEASISVVVFNPDEITQIVDADGVVVGFVCPLCGHQVLLQDARFLRDTYRGCPQEGCAAVVRYHDLWEQP